MKANLFLKHFLINSKSDEGNETYFSKCFDFTTTLEDVKFNKEIVPLPEKCLDTFHTVFVTDCY